ncbi:testin-like [Clytia hemisphaerica]|uniref:Uncharacterized protein n=2 Tax=Clytia hemisphaerica TaxID=252671 RepID=A0A7M5XDB4_9CNID
MFLFPVSTTKMEDEYRNVKFHSFKLSTKQSEYSGPEFADIEGIKCLQCKSNCFGFLQHHWRRCCVNCRCPLWKHDVPPAYLDLPFERLRLEENDPPEITEYERAREDGYEWVPRVPERWQAEKYMRSLPLEKVPKKHSTGGDERARQLVYQLPKQDYNIKYANSVTDEKSHKSFNDMKRRLVRDSLGVGSIIPSIQQETACSNCFQDIAIGTVAVVANRFDSSNVWHPSCFKCCIDGELLVDMIYFCWDNRLYCGRHHGELFKPRCHGCEELIYVGEYTKAMGKLWHLDHFCCWQCDMPLTSKKYIAINNQPFCITCYNNIIANRCDICKEPIGPDSKDLFVNEKHYHSRCLVCATCNIPLEAKSFSFVNESPVCHQCRGIDPDKAISCEECQVYFMNNERKIGFGDCFYHEKCFLCSDCRQPIGSSKFVRKKKDGRKLCDDCFQRTAKICYKCTGVIKTSTIQFEGKSFHDDCFVCHDCKKGLSKLNFYKRNHLFYCEECFFRDHLQQCPQCLEYIRGGDKYVGWGGETWHSRCFNCVICQGELANGRFIVRNGKRFCRDCKEKAPMTLL